MGGGMKNTVSVSGKEFPNLWPNLTPDAEYWMENIFFNFFIFFIYGAGSLFLL